MRRLQVLVLFGSGATLEEPLDQRYSQIGSQSTVTEAESVADSICSIFFDSLIFQFGCYSESFRDIGVSCKRHLFSTKLGGI